MSDAVTDIRIYDHNWGGAGLPIDDFTKASMTWRRSAAGAGSVEAPWGSEAVARCCKADTDFVPLVAQMNGRRWEGWVTKSEVTGGFGEKSVAITTVHVWAILRTILTWPSPGLPLGTQPGIDIYIGPAMTGILGYIARNAARLGLPMLVLPLAGPDTTPFVAWQPRMVSVADLAEGTLKETLDRHLSVRMWLPGDPQIPGYTLTQPTYVVEAKAAVNRPGVVFEESADHVSATVAVKAPEAGAVISGGKTNDFLRQLLPDLVNAFPDWFFAFDYWPNPNAGTWGSYFPREVYKSASAAYTTDSLQAGRQAMVDLAGRRNVNFTVDGVAPGSVGYAADIGDVVGAWLETENAPGSSPSDAGAVVVSDFIGSITVTEDREKGVTMGFTLGDNRPDPADPTAQLVGRVLGLIKQVTELGKSA